MPATMSNAAQRGSTRSNAAAPARLANPKTNKAKTAAAASSAPPVAFSAAIPRISSLARATCCRISSDRSVPIERRSSWRPCRARSSVATSTGHHPFLPVATVESASERFLPAPVRPNRTASERVPHLLDVEALERREDEVGLGQVEPGGGLVRDADARDAAGLAGPDP